jgi:2-polyprenyl-3-methyl-5-hydroxy-6-metoxy-1,4-benzoquinol methylase
LYNENTERDQFRIDVTVSLFKATGEVLFSENKSIYKHLALRIKGKRILEIGCGIGLGSALLDRNNEVFATDKLSDNAQLAKSLYPWVNFNVLDISKISLKGFDVVVCVDVLEHIKDYKSALDNIIKSGEEVWLSTPNRNHPGIGKDKPHNIFHVKEFTPREMLDMIGKENVEMYTWDTFERVGVDSISTPLVYKI